jgi:hypothetical protein
VSDPIPSEQELISDLQLAAQTRADEDKLKDASKQALALLRQQWKEAATDWDVIERASDWVTRFRKLVTKPPTGSLFSAEELIECTINLLTDEHQSLTQDSPERTSLLQFVGDVETAARQLGRFSMDIPLLADLRIADELHRKNTEMNSLALLLRDIVDFSRVAGMCPFRQPQPAQKMRRFLKPFTTTRMRQG